MPVTVGGTTSISASPTFETGTTVQLFLTHVFPGPGPITGVAPPPGAVPLETVTVDVAGMATFTGLQPSQRYAVAAQVLTVVPGNKLELIWRYISFLTEPEAEGGVAVGALLAVNNLADLQNIAAALANLGIGTAGLEPASAFERAVPSVRVSGTIYVSPLGDDSKDGLSWATAKRTLQAAHDALPTTGEFLQSGKPARSGQVRMGAATGLDATCPRFVLSSQITASGETEFPGGRTYEPASPGKPHPKGKRGRPFVKVNMGGGKLAGSAADIGRVLVNPEMPSKSMEAAEILDYWEGEIDEIASAAFPASAKNPTGGSGKKVRKGEAGPSGHVSTATTTFFTLSKPVGKKITELLYIVEPAVKTSPGVAWVGNGQMAGVVGVGRRGTHGPTVLEVTGSGGMGFYIESGLPKTPVEGRNTFVDFTLLGKQRPKKKEEGFGEYRADMPIWGFYVQDTFGTTFERLTVIGFSGWGAYIGNNAGAEFMASLCNFTENGNVSSKIGPSLEKQMTGNLSSEGGTPIQSLYNCLFLNGFGCCAAIKGMHCIGNSFNHAQKSFWEAGAKKLSGSGTNVLTGGDQTPTNIIGGWMEGGTVQVRSKGGYTTIVGVRCQGINGEPQGNEEGGEEEEEIPNWSESEEYVEGDLVESVVGKPKGSGIWESLQADNVGHKPGAVGSEEWWIELEPAEYSIEGGATILNCYFRHYAKACVKETSTQPGSWKNCSCGGTGKETVRGIPFIEKQGGLPDVPLFAMYGEGRYGGEEKEGLEPIGANVVSSVPLAPEEVTLEVLGIAAVGWTAAFGADIDLVVPITPTEAGATVTIERSAGSAWSKAYPAEGVAVAKNFLFGLAAGETVKITTVKATVGKALLKRR